MIDGLLPKFKAGDALKAADLQRISDIVGGLTNSNRGALLHGLNIGGMRFSAANESNIYTTPFYNNSTFTVPAYGVVRISNYARGVPSVSRSNIYGAQYNHLVNGPYNVDNTLFGNAASSFPAMAAYDSADGTPAFGELWGPRSGTFLLKKNTPGFRVVGGTVSGDGNDEYANGIDTVAHLVLVRPEPFLRFRGTTTIAHNYQTSQSVNIFYGTGGSYIDSTIDMANVYNDFADLAISKQVECVWENDYLGTSWKIVAGRCGA